MKKIVYIALLAFVSALSLSSCTEQEIRPRDGGGSGGSGIDPKG